ncbi:MAG TPA: hypothetical protein VF120_10990 [Ktedonobacterales bacterium]
MASRRRAAADGDDEQRVSVQVTELRGLIEHLQEQRREDHQRAERQQAEISALRAELADVRARGVGASSVSAASAASARPQQRGRMTSRRELLTAAGATAAAATVALVASEGQATHAAPAVDGDAILAGQITTASSQTTLQPVSGSSPNYILVVNGGTGTGDINGIGGYALGAGNGVYGAGSSGTGVLGASGANGIGVRGVSASGYALTANSGSSVDIYANGTGRFQQLLQGTAGAPTSGTYSAGEQIRDSNGNLFLCTASGTPGIWKQVFAAGSTISDSSGTTLAAAASSSPSILLQVDASNSTFASAGPIAIMGTANPSGTNAFNAYGVYGYANKGFAVYGQSASGFGVSGFATTGVAVTGTANGSGGTAVAAYSTSSLDLVAGGTGRIQQNLQSAAGAPTGGPYNAGEQVRDSNGELWLCTASGSPGNWVKAAHIPNGYSGGATVYLSKPIRLLDTRPGDSNAWQNPGSPYASGSTHTLQIAGVSWQSVTVPSNAVGAIGKLTVISYASGTGYVAIVPSGVTPTTGTLPYGANQTVATSFNVGLGGSPGSIDIYVGGTQVDVVIDLFGVVA